MVKCVFLGVTSWMLVLTSTDIAFGQEQWQPSRLTGLQAPVAATTTDRECGPTQATRTARDVAFLKPVDPANLSKSKDEQTYTVNDYSVDIRGNLISRIELARLKENSLCGDMDVITLMRNRSDSSLTPFFTFRVYNRYGMRLGEWRVQWSFFSSVEPGQTYSETTRIRTMNFKEVFRNTSINVPADINVPAYIVVDACQTKLRRAASRAP